MESHISEALKSRKVIHFGYEFDYDNNAASKDPSPNRMPVVCEPIIERMLDARIFTERPDQLTVNIYEPGNGIPSHVDTHSAFGDTIASLSLLSGLFVSASSVNNNSRLFYLSVFWHLSARFDRCRDFVLAFHVMDSLDSRFLALGYNNKLLEQ